MKAIYYIFGTLWLIAFSGNTLLFLYVEWLYLSRSFYEILNPFLHLKVVGSLLTLPLFWGLLLVTAIGLLGMTQAEKRLASRQVQSASH